MRANYQFTPAGEFVGKKLSPLPTQTRSRSHADDKPKVIEHTRIIEKEYEKIDWQRIEDMIEDRIRRNNSDIDKRIYDITTLIEDCKNDNNQALLELARNDAELEKIIALLEEKMKVYTDNRIKEILTTLKKHEKRMEDLNKKYNGLEKALHEMETNLKKYINGKIDDLMELIQNLSKQLSELENKVKDTDRRIGLLEESVKKQFIEMEERVDTFINEQEKRIAELEEHDKELEDKINDTELRLREELLRHEEAENEKMQELNDRCSRLELDMRVLESNLKKYIDDKLFIYTQRMEKRMAELDDKDTDLEKKIKLLDSTLRKYTDNRIAEVFTHMEVQDKRISEVEDKNTELAAKLTALKREVKQYIDKKVKAILEAMQKRFDSIREELKSTKDQLRSELQEDKKENKDKFAIIHGMVEDLKKKDMNLETALGLLETRITRYLEERLQATESSVEKQLTGFKEMLDSIESKLDLKIKAHESYVNSRLDNKDKNVEELAIYIVQVEKLLKELNEKLKNDTHEKLVKLANQVYNLSNTVSSLNGSLETIESDHERLNDVVKAEHADRLERMEVLVISHEKKARKELQIQDTLDSYKNDIHMIKGHINALHKEMDILKGLNTDTRKNCLNSKVNVKELDARVKNIGDNMRNIGSSAKNNVQSLKGKIIDLEEKTVRNELSLTNLLESGHRKASTLHGKVDSPVNIKAKSSLHKTTEQEDSKTIRKS